MVTGIRLGCKFLKSVFSLNIYPAPFSLVGTCIVAWTLLPKEKTDNSGSMKCVRACTCVCVCVCVCV